LHFLFYFLEPASAIGGTYWLHFVAAAWVLYLVGVVLNLGKWAKLLMAVSAMFSYKLVLAIYTGWAVFIPSIICFPLLFASAFYVVNRSGLKAILALSGAGAFCLHTGHLQLIYYTMWFVAAYLSAQAITWWLTGQRQAVRQIAWRLLWGSLLGVGITAYLLIPLAGEAHLLSRSQASYATFVSSHALTFRHLLTFFHPEAIGNPLQPTLWEDIAYFGLLQLILAVVGAVLGWRRCSPTRFLVVSFVVSLIMSMDSPLLRFLYDVLPGFRLFRCPSRFLFITAFFGITLAGIGLDQLIHRVGQRWPKRFFAPVFTAVLLVIVSLEGIWYIRQYLTTVPHQEVIPSTAYEEFFASDNTTFRIATLHGPTINYGWAASMDLQMISGFEPFNLSHYQAYFDLLEWGAVGSKDARHFMDLSRISQPDFLDALNVKYLVSPAPLRGPSRRFEEVRRWKDQPVFVFFSGMTRSDIYAYRNNHFLPRAFWVDELVEVEGEKEMIAMMKQKELSHTATILGPKQRVIFCSVSPEDEVEVLGASGGYLSLQTQNRARRFLVKRSFSFIAPILP
jgi:hypothetical protein